MITEQLGPLLDKLAGYDELVYTLPDGRDIWLEIIAAKNRVGRDWSDYVVQCEQRAREFRSFNRLPEALHALLGDLALSTDLIISLRSEDWHETSAA